MRAHILTLLVASLAASPDLRAADEPTADVESLASLVELLIEADPDSARQCLCTLAEKIRNGELDAATIGKLKGRLAEPLKKVVSEKADGPLGRDASLLAALWNDDAALQAVRGQAESDTATPDERQVALQTLVAAQDAGALKIAGAILGSQGDDHDRAVLAALAKSSNPAVADVVLSAYSQLSAQSQPLAIELLTQRVIWSQPLVASVAAKKIPVEALNVNQVRKLLSLGSDELTAEVTRHWGTIREGRDPAREQLIVQMRELLAKTPGDPHRGIAVFGKLCGQCHKIHGQGQEVGPDITLNGRSSLDQLLSNVFDPSLVIGASYQARTVRTLDGLVIAGLLVEDNEQRVVLKVQGGKLETIARDDVEAIKVSALSLMPEGIEKQLQPQEIADLFAFITLDKHPDDKTARRIAGSLAPAAGGP